MQVSHEQTRSARHNTGQATCHDVTHEEQPRAQRRACHTLDAMLQTESSQITSSLCGVSAINVCQASTCPCGSTCRVSMHAGCPCMAHLFVCEDLIPGSCLHVRVFNVHQRTARVTQPHTATPVTTKASPPLSTAFAHRCVLSRCPKRERPDQTWIRSCVCVCVCVCVRARAYVCVCVSDTHRRSSPDTTIALPALMCSSSIIPISCAMALAVMGWSPVTMNTRILACEHRNTHRHTHKHTQTHTDTHRGTACKDTRPEPAQAQAQTGSSTGSSTDKGTMAMIG